MTNLMGFKILNKTPKAIRNAKITVAEVIVSLFDPTGPFTYEIME